MCIAGDLPTYLPDRPIGVLPFCTNLYGGPEVSCAVEAGPNNLPSYSEQEVYWAGTHVHMDTAHSQVTLRSMRVRTSPIWSREVRTSVVDVERYHVEI